MRMQLGRWRFPIGTGIALLVGVVFTACCPKGPRPPEPVAGCPPGKPPSTQAELDACLQKLEFDDSYEVIDEQPLAVITTSQGQPCPGDTTGSPLRCRYGPVAKIQPLIGAHRYSEEELMEGRIIAKLSVDSTEKEGYKKYGLMPGEATYWWVQTDKTRRGGRSFFLTTTGRAGEIDTLSRPLIRKLDDDPEYKDPDSRSRDSGSKYQGSNSRSEKLPKLRRAIVRWIWSLEDETAKGKCGAGSCN